MKGYTVTVAELWTLGLVQGGSALSFAIAGSAIGFWVSTKQAVDLASSDAAIALRRAQWEAYGDVGFFIAIGFGIIGIALFGISGFQAYRITEATIHD